MFEPIPADATKLRRACGAAPNLEKQMPIPTELVDYLSSRSTVPARPDGPVITFYRFTYRFGYLIVD